jgi:outer membrane translocation and assembly module TamA
MLHSCSVRKYLNDDQSLLVKNKVEIEKPYSKEISRNITKYYKLKPNRRFLLVINSRPYFFFMGSRGKDNWLKRFERNTMGESPALVDSIYMESTVKSFRNYLRGLGYYYPDVSYEVKVSKAKKATIIYKIRLNKRYYFGEYELQIADKEIYELVSKNMDETFIKSGHAFRHDDLLKEQERIIILLQNNGYFAMSNDYVDFDVDTATADGRVRLGLNIVNRNDTLLHKKYYVNDITVDIERTIGVPNNPADTIRLNGIRYNMGKYKLNPNLLDRNILFRKGELYRQQKFNRTYTRLADLNIFRYINIQPRPMEFADSGLIDYSIKLTPAVKYSFTLEPQAITSDQNNTLTNQNFRNYGIALLSQLSNRNIFRNAEILQLSFRSAFEAQGQVQSGTFFNSTEQSLTASVIMPRILFFPSFDKNLSYQSTRSIISTSAIYEVNTDYKRTVFTTGLNYQFNKKLFTYYFAPMEFSYIRSEIRSDTLRRQSENDIFLQNLFSNNLILNSRFGFTYSNRSVAKGISFINIRWDALELAGNLLTLINNIANTPKDNTGTYTLFGVKYFQYAKTALDVRYNTIFDENNATVIRAYLGVAVPYGNTPDFVPFERRFFIGGVNSLRAWRPRAIGPGTFREANQLDFSGEIKLETNLEYRFNIYNRWLEGAVFTDAGNVWAIKKDPARPGAEFEFNNFYKALAWDAGVGVRLNFTIVIVRFDFAFPLVDPTYAEADRWVSRDILQRGWLVRNTNFNFGIGYPF